MPSHSYWHVLQRWTEQEGWTDVQECDSREECRERKWELENLHGYTCRIIQRRRKR